MSGVLVLTFSVYKECWEGASLPQIRFPFNRHRGGGGCCGNAVFAERQVAVEKKFV